MVVVLPRPRAIHKKEYQQRNPPPDAYRCCSDILLLFDFLVSRMIPIVVNVVSPGSLILVNVALLRLAMNFVVFINNQQPRKEIVMTLHRDWDIIMIYGKV